MSSMTDDLLDAANEAREAALEAQKKIDESAKTTTDNETQKAAVPKKPKAAKTSKLGGKGGTVIDYGFTSSPEQTGEETTREPAPNLPAENVESSTELTVDDLAQAEAPDTPNIDSVGQRQTIINNSMELTAEDLKAYFPSEDITGLDSFGDKVATGLNAYVKSLITQYGMEPSEALQARDNKAKKDIIKEQEEFFKANPNVGVVTIRSGEEGALGLTPEEHEKLSRSKRIHLVELEEAILKTIPIVAVDAQNKTNYLNGITGIYAQDNVPLPMACDYATFKGIQIFQLLEATSRDDDRIDEVIARKAAVIYNSFMGSTRMKKFNDKNEIILSYQDFLTQFYFYDMDMALYSVLCASSKEITTGEMRCPRCGRDFKAQYNIRKVLKLDGLSDDFKQRIDGILEYRTNPEHLKTLEDRFCTGLRMKSPFSNNIYDLKSPSISKALNVTQYLGSSSTDNEAKFVVLAMHINSMYVWEPAKDGYIPIDAAEHNLLFNWTSRIPQEDVDAIWSLIKDHMYAPRFATQVKCNIDDKCHHEMDADFDISDWIFLRGRDTPAEIE